MVAQSITRCSGKFMSRRNFDLAVEPSKWVKGERFESIYLWFRTASFTALQFASSHQVNIVLMKNRFGCDRDQNTDENASLLRFWSQLFLLKNFFSRIMNNKYRKQ